MQLLIIMLSSVLIVLASVCFVVLPKKQQASSKSLNWMGWVLLSFSFLVLLLNPGYLKPIVTWLGLLSLIYMMVVIFFGLRSGSEK